MVRITIDGVQQMPGGASADFLQIVVERGDRHAAFGGGDLPIVMTDNRDILWHTYTLGEQCLDDSACKHVVEAVDAVDANAFAKQQLYGCASP